MKWFYLVLSLLAAWRVTHLLQAEDGPFDIIYRFRKMLGNSVFGKMMDCFNCMSIWVAIPFAWFLGKTWAEKVLFWFALSGGAILLERITKKNNDKDGFIQEFNKD